MVTIAKLDGSDRDWLSIRALLQKVVVEDQRKTTKGGGTRVVYRVNPEIAEQLAVQWIYVEQGRSGRKNARRRPLFERMKRDAAGRKFDRLLVWKVSRLGRNMREVINSVYELSDHGVTVFPVKSQTGAMNSTLGKLLWAIQAWFSDERLQMTVLDLRSLTNLESRILFQGEEESSGRGYLTLEGTDARVHYIYYTPEIEAARNRGALRANSFVQLRKSTVDGRRRWK